MEYVPRYSNNGLYFYISLYNTFYYSLLWSLQIFWCFSDIQWLSSPKQYYFFFGFIMLEFIYALPYIIEMSILLVFISLNGSIFRGLVSLEALMHFTLWPELTFCGSTSIHYCPSVLQTLHFIQLSHVLICRWFLKIFSKLYFFD